MKTQEDHTDTKTTINSRKEHLSTKEHYNLNNGIPTVSDILFLYYIDMVYE